VTVAVFAHADQLVVALAGWDAFYSLRKRIAVPIAAVATVRVRLAAELVADRPSLRSRGAYLPGVMAIGGFRRIGDGGVQFWCVHEAKEVVAIDLDGTAAFERIVLQVRDPAAVVRELAVA
jgi:hypothetical protein